MYRFFWDSVYIVFYIKWQSEELYQLHVACYNPGFILQEGNTALHFAVKNCDFGSNYISAVELLLDHFADIDIRNKVSSCIHKTINMITICKYKETSNK